MKPNTLTITVNAIDEKSFTDYVKEHHDEWCSCLSCNKEEKVAFRNLTFNQISKLDPSGTLRIKKKFIADSDRRFNWIKKIIRAVFKEDLLGLGTDTNKTGLEGLSEIITNELPVEDAIKRLRDKNLKVFSSSADKVSGFMDWLDDMEDQSILEITRRPGLKPGGAPWSDVYIHSAYQKGFLNGRNELIAQGVEVPTFSPDPALDMSVALNQPFHAERVALLYTRTFQELKGIDAAMDQQLSRILSQGMSEGKNPLRIAKELTDKTDMLKRRARMVARTEVIRAHHEANINEFERAGIAGVTVRAEWVTGVKPCPICQKLEARSRKKPFSLDEIRPLIPAHPNCVCVAVPVVPEPGEGTTTVPTTPVQETLPFKTPTPIVPKIKKPRKPRTPKVPADLVAQSFYDPKHGIDYMKYKSEYKKAFEKYSDEDFALLKRFIDEDADREDMILMLMEEDAELLVEDTFITSTEEADRLIKLYGDIVNRATDKQISFCLNEWQDDTSTINAMFLKQKTFNLEKNVSDMVYNEDFIEAIMEEGYLNPEDPLAETDFLSFIRKSFSKEADRAISDKSYLRLRAFNQVLMERLDYTEPITLYRGTDGSTGEKLAKMLNDTNSKEIVIKDASLTGYSSSRGLADGFGYESDGITVRLEVDPSEVVVSKYSFSGLTGQYVNEEEWIVIGRNRIVKRRDIKF